MVFGLHRLAMQAVATINIPNSYSVPQSSEGTLDQDHLMPSTPPWHTVVVMAPLITPSPLDTRSLPPSIPLVQELTHLSPRSLVFRERNTLQPTPCQQGQDTERVSRFFVHRSLWRGRGIDLMCISTCSGRLELIRQRPVFIFWVGHTPSPS